MPIKPMLVQRRMMELGRVRLGEKGAKGEPRKLDTFRFTSASRVLLEAVAERYGGEVREWQGAPDEGYYEVVTKADALDVVFPPIYSDADGSPTVPFSQWMELWKSGGCERRCDGETEALSGKACLCDPKDRACKPTTRISFMLPDIPGLGVWRVESKGWNAAAETPAAVSVLVRAATEGRFIPAVLRLENRTSKKGGTRKFVVPVIDVAGATLNELAGGDIREALAINPPQPNPPRPALPPGSPEPEPEPFEHDEPGEFGKPPPLPDDPPEPDPLEVDAFRKLCAEAFISPQKVGAVGKGLFPGRSMKDLSDAERGTLWAELSQQEVPA